MGLRLEIRKDGEYRIRLERGRALRKAAAYQRSSTISKIRNTTTPANAPLTVSIKKSSKPLADTGLLMSTITYGVRDDMAVIGTNRRGARMANFGGVVRPRNARDLWIPASSRIRKELMAYGGKIGPLIRQYRSSGYYVFRRGNAFFARKRGSKQSKPIMLFILKKSVTVPARPFMYFSEIDMEIIGKIMKETIIEKST